MEQIINKVNDNNSNKIDLNIKNEFLSKSFKLNDTISINDFIENLKDFNSEVDNSIRDKVLK